MTVDELNIRLTADINDLRSQMNQANEQMKKFEQASVNASASALNGFKQLTSGLAALGIGKILKDSINAAGELEQSIGGASSVFKEYADTVQKSAQTAASSLGLAQSEYLATATKMGALFQGSGFSVAKSADMTTKAMQRAADVASIMGISTAEAMNAVAGAAKGNFTMMDNLGVAMNDTALQSYAAEKGLGKLETTQQKVNAAMQMFIEKTEYAAGNYARENDTYAGSLSTLSAELKNFMAEAGTALMPVAMGALQITSAVVTAVKPLILGVASAIGTVGQAFNALTGPQKNTLVLALGLCVAIPILTKAKMALGAAIGFVAGKQLTLMTLMKGGLITIGLVIAAMTLLKGHNQALADTEDDIGKSAGDAEKSAEKAAKGVDGLTDSLKDAKKAVGGLAGFDEITKLSGSGSGLLTDGLIGEDFEAELAELTEGMGELQNGAEDVTASFGDLGDMFGLDLEAFKDFWGGVIDKIRAGDWEDALSDILSGFDSLMENVFGDLYTDVRDYWTEIKEIADKEGVLEATGKVCSDIDTILSTAFGKSWNDFSTFWQKVGGKIASGDWEGALSLLGEGFNDIMSKIHGKSWTIFTTTWDNVLGKLKGGDLLGAVEALLNGIDDAIYNNCTDISQKFETMFKTIDDMFGWHISEWWSEWTGFFNDFGAGIYNMLNAEKLSQINSESDFQKQYGVGAVGYVNDAIVDYLKQGYSSDDAVRAVMNNTDDAQLMAAWKVASKADGFDVSRYYKDAAEWQSNLINSGQLTRSPMGDYVYVADTVSSSSSSKPSGWATAEYYRQQGEAALAKSKVDTSQVSDPPASANDMYDVAKATQTDKNGDPINFNVTVELDGEAVGSTSASYRDGQVITSNGLY